jgi:hypothetical protein
VPQYQPYDRDNTIDIAKIDYESLVVKLNSSILQLIDDYDLENAIKSILNISDNELCNKIVKIVIELDPGLKKINDVSRMSFEDVHEYRLWNTSK